MAVYAKIIYHIVFTTKHSVAFPGKPKGQELYGFVWEHLKTRHCRLHRIGGTEDHVHLLNGLHPAVELAILMKELKSRLGKMGLTFR